MECFKVSPESSTFSPSDCWRKKCVKYFFKIMYKRCPSLQFLTAQSPVRWASFENFLERWCSNTTKTCRIGSLKSFGLWHKEKSAKFWDYLKLLLAVGMFFCSLVLGVSRCHLFDSLMVEGRRSGGAWTKSCASCGSH